MRRPLHDLLKRRRARRSDRGIAMVLSLFLMLAMSVVAASLMFLSQTETYASMNYRMMSQARYGAESGIQVAGNYLLYTYTAPSTAGPDVLSNYNTTVSPVTYNGQPVILSANSSVASNYPYAATKTAFASSVTDTISLGATNTTKVTYAPYATLMSMELIPAANSLDSLDHVIQTWQITSDGTITGASRNAQVEVSAIIDTQKLSTSSSSVNYAAFAVSATCGALKLSGGASTKSYDSSALSGGNPVVSSSGGNVGTNGNLTESGGATINGTLSTPRVGVGSCSSGNVDAETTSGGASVTGGLVHLPSAVSLPAPTIATPNLGAPPSTSVNVTNTTTCASLVAVVPAANCSGSAGNLTFTATAGTPLVLGNVSVTSSGHLAIASSAGSSLTYTMNTLSVAGSGILALGGASTDQPITLNATSIATSGGGVATMGSGTYNTNSVSISGGTTLTVNSQAQVTMDVIKTFSMSGGGALVLPADTGASPASVALNVVNTTTVASPIDFSGGTVTNNSYDASRFIIQYAGSGSIALSGGTKQAEVVYAPLSNISFSGGAALYGEAIGATITDSGGATVYYDRNLATKGLFSTTKYYPGQPMLSTFSWKKY